MKPSQRSRTAEGSALMRAAHLALDRSPWIFEDVFARRLLGPFPRLLLTAPSLLRMAERIEPLLAAARTQAVVRSRFAEDRLRDAIARGVRQYVLLSAGLDSFSLRGPVSAPSLRVFEVDHPASQAWKRTKLDPLTTKPTSTTFVPLDFESGALAEALLEKGFLSEEPAFFSWLGSTYYLSHDVARGTLAVLTSLAAPGSELVFDYLLADWALEPSEVRLLRRAKAFSGGLGEPLRGAFDPEALHETLSSLGWRVLEDLSAQDQRDAYLANRSDSLLLPGWNRLVRARAARARPT
jgi:methyltransferase (TIGR00027 family)